MNWFRDWFYCCCNSCVRFHAQCDCWYLFNALFWICLRSYFGWLTVSHSIEKPQKPQTNVSNSDFNPSVCSSYCNRCCATFSINRFHLFIKFFLLCLIFILLQYLVRCSKIQPKVLVKHDWEVFTSSLESGSHQILLYHA